MRRFLARFSEPVWSGHVPSWADFITTTPELKFSVHTARRLRHPVRRAECQSRRRKAGADSPDGQRHFEPLTLSIRGPALCAHTEWHVTDAAGRIPCRTR